ncbi:MAG: hypothetical protein ISP10_02915 [Aeromicrobium sp.]|jgi:uncharacterized protein with PQ loop repeat|nr:hypothetical protein [Aeromicrobium sp.]
MLASRVDSKLREAEATLAPHVAHVEKTMKPHVRRALLTLGLLYPVAMAPQIYNVWVLHRTAGLSELTYMAGLMMALLWTAHGLLNRDKAVFGLNALWIGVHATMIAGLLR